MSQSSLNKPFLTHGAFTISLFTWSKLVAILISIVFLASCKNGNSEEKADKTIVADSMYIHDPSIPGSFHAKTDIIFDSLAINRFFDSFPLFKPLTKEFYSFYRQRQFSYAWYDQSGLIEPAGNLFNRIMNIQEDGLPERIAYKEVFISLMETEKENPAFSVSLELMLTAQYFSFGRLAWQGLDESESRSLKWLLPRKQVSLTDMLDSLVSGKAAFDQEPVYRQYGLLKDYLKKYKAIRDQGGWPVIGSVKKSLKAGDSSLIIPSVKQYLFITGDWASQDRSGIFDPNLAKAVIQYQKRLGLKEDTIIGQGMIRAMNVPVEKRIRQIIANMERCRWVPVGLSDHYLVVNIPEFKLHLFEHDSLRWSMNVVVGKAQHNTVIFNGLIRYVVFSPYWNVPNSILKKEILPALRKNKNYLVKNNMEWYDNGKVRQKPGPSNALGLVKFLFPNNHSIYLHDTPAKSLFEESSRAFSHGCIRLSDAKKLAMYLLRTDPEWTERKIDSAMHAGVEKHVTLKNSIPVFIAYFTSWVSRDGLLQFRQDIYERDERLVSAIIN